MWFVLDTISLILADSIKRENLSHHFLQISKSIKDNVCNVEESNLDCLIHKIEKAKSLYFLGVGRANLVLNSFAMRLYHMGFNVRIYGESRWRLPQERDLLVVCDLAEDLKKYFPYVATVFDVKTLFGECDSSSYMGLGNGYHNVLNGNRNQQPSYMKKFLFDEDNFLHVLYVVLDYIVYKMMMINDLSELDLASRHVNIQ